MKSKLAKFFSRTFRKKRAPLHKRFRVGRGTYGDPKVMHWGEPATLEVGAFCSIAEDVTIFLGGNHRVDWITTYPFPDLRESAKSIAGHPATRGDVRIGNDVWIGWRATILSGVTIGNGAVIGACALVTNDVPPYAIVGGNPAKILRHRFSPEDIARLEHIQWWNWPDGKIDRAMPLLLSGNIAALADFAAANP